MRLASIKLSGFKSFCDQTSLVFPSDRTVLVGPNGCGKSNIIDAIRWVLGQSTASGLRTDSMDDVIFNGTDDQPPRGRAMVEMVFSNDKKRLVGQYKDLEQVKVKRVLERDNNSRYYINDAPCLRKNITEIFAGMGLTGKTDYAIVTQGAVHNIVESNPDYIRTVIEEVADITTYLNKRKDSLNHIRRTKDNLRTIHSNLAEMKHRVKSLDKQAEMASVYKKNQDELMRLKEHLTLARYNQLMDKKEAKRVTLNQLVQKISETKNNSALWEAQKQELSLTADEKNKDLIAEMTAQRNLMDEIADLDARNKYNRKNLEDKEEQLNTTKKEAVHINQRLQEQSQKLNESRQELKALKDKQSGGNEQSSPQDASPSLTALRKLETHISDTNKEWQELVNAAMGIHARHKDAEVKLRECLSSQENISRQLEELSRQQDTHKNTQVDLTRLNKEQTSITAKISSLGKQEHSLQQDITALDERTAKTETELRTSADEYLRLGTLLEELDKASGETDKGLSANIKKLLSAMKIDTTGLWGDKVEIADGWEKALDIVASRMLQANFTENISAALASLAKEKDIRVGLIDNSSAGDKEKVDKLGDAKSMAELIKLSNKPSFLNHIYSCNDLQEAIKLRKQLKSYQSIVTPRGDWLGPDWAVLQSENLAADNIGSVTRKKRQQQLSHKFAKASKEKDTLATTLDKLKKTQRESSAAMAAVRAEMAELKQQAAKIGQEILGKQARLNESPEINPEDWKQQKDQHKNQLTTIEKQIKEYRSELEKVEQTKNQQDAARNALETQRAELATQLNKLQEERQQQEELQQQEQERREKLLTLISSMETELITLRANEEKMKLRAEELLSDTFTARNTVKQDDQKLAELSKSNDKLAAVIAKKENEQAKLGSKLEDVERNITRGERDIAVFEEKIDQSRGDENQLELELGELQKRLSVEAQTEKQKEQLRELGDPSTIQTRINLLQRENDRMGDVNMLALKDFKQEKEKYDHLLSQEAEINKALDNLNKAIKRIDRESQSRFDATFNKVNTNFSKLFSTLTQGGKGTLQVEKNENGNNGIRIMASPPGKRNTMLSLLSGGEKTVTAIAFIMAIFQLNPAPFCLLDEADAMLDDQNIIRFNAMMDEMAAAAAVQFIIITHSKISMQEAKHLIGVTMSEPGVSRIVTVDMNKAMELSQADA